MVLALYAAYFAMVQTTAVITATSGVAVWTSAARTTVAVLMDAREQQVVARAGVASAGGYCQTVARVLMSTSAQRMHLAITTAGTRRVASYVRARMVTG